VNGYLAFITPNQRGIVVVRPGQAPREFRGPRTDISFLQWSSDGAALLYFYRLGPWRHSIWSLVSDNWGVGLMDVSTGRHYRMLPGYYGGVHIREAMGRGRGHCVSAIQPGLAEHLREAEAR
jgi:hypothetical protein